MRREPATFLPSITVTPTAVGPFILILHRIACHRQRNLRLLQHSPKRLIPRFREINGLELCLVPYPTKPPTAIVPSLAQHKHKPKFIQTEITKRILRSPRITPSIQQNLHHRQPAIVVITPTPLPPCLIHMPHRLMQTCIPLSPLRDIDLHALLIEQ